MSLKAIRTGGIFIPNQYHRMHPYLADLFVEERGIQVVWEKCLICPCLSDYGTPDPYCDSCFGRGYLYTAKSTIPALFTDIQGVPQFLRPGFWLWGTAYVSTPSSVRLAFRDRLILTSYTTTYLETKVVSEGKVVFTLRKPESIEQVAYRDGEGKVVFLTDREYTYRDGELTFAATVPNGAKVSVRYSASLVYVVVNLLHEARGWTNEQGKVVTLPNQYLVQREDLVVETKHALTEE